MEQVIGQLDREEFTAWRIAAADMTIAELRHKLAIKEASHLELQIEIEKMKVEAYKRTQVRGFSDAYQQKKAEFAVIIKAIEEKIGHPLKECAINDITLEVLKVDV